MDHEAIASAEETEKQTVEESQKEDAGQNAATGSASDAAQRTETGSATDAEQTAATAQTAGAEETASTAPAANAAPAAETGTEPGEKKKKHRKKRVIPVVILVILAGIYAAGTVFFSSHFFPNTIINGISCGFKSRDDSVALFEEQAAAYVLTLKEQGDQTEEIKSSDIDLSVDSESVLEELLSAQKGCEWILHLTGEEAQEIDTVVSYDTAKLDQVISSLQCLDESRVTEPENTTLSEYKAGTGYELVPAVYGTRIDAASLESEVEQALNEFSDTLDLKAEGCYVEPVYTEESKEAKAMLEAANAYAGTTLTYQFGDQTEVLDGSTISSWIRVDENLNVSLDQDAEAQYIAQLAEKYDTKWQSRTITAHSGSTVTVPAGGNYGWKMNQEDTLAALRETLESGQDYTGEVVWYQTAAQYGEQDYGSTYVEVSISAQHLWYYQDGVVVLESDFVSGNVAKGHSTPKGAYKLAYKARNQVLKGQGYASPVSYWMPFVDGCGFHDADWRSSFGGSIYRTNGSHGCINMPPSKAKELYGLIEAGTAILIY